MNLKRPWLHEVDATTALFVRQHAVHTNKFEQKTESLSRSNDGTLWKVDRYEFDQVYNQALDDTYRSIRRQAADIFSFFIRMAYKSMKVSRMKRYCDP